MTRCRGGRYDLRGPFKPPEPPDRSGVRGRENQTFVIERRLWPEQHLHQPHQAGRSSGRFTSTQSCNEKIFSDISREVTHSFFPDLLFVTVASEN